MKVDFTDVRRQLMECHEIKRQYDRTYEADFARRLWSILKESENLLNDRYFDMTYLQDNVDELARDAQAIKVQDLKERDELREMLGE